jgi:hypothetical protein
MPAAKTHPTLELTQKRHRDRLERHTYPEIEGDPELSSAYHSLQLHWLSKVPGYREALKAKVNEAATAAEKKAQRIEFGQRTVYGERLSQALRDDQLERLAGY